MTQEAALIENVTAPDKKPMPEKVYLMPDGMGLSLEQVQELMAKVHKIIVAKDEPALLTATIFNAYLGEIQKLHTRHEKGLTRLMGEKTDAYVTGVQAGVEQLSKSLSSASVEGIRKVFDDHAARLNAFKNSTAWLAAIVAVSALVNVAVFVLKAVR